MRWRIRKAWHKLVCRVFKSHIQDVITEALHPEFGWWWRSDEDGGKALASEYLRGFEDGKKWFDRREGGPS